MADTLSTQVIRRDQALERAHATSQEELAKHRWRWTLDESNPKRVSIRAYAQAVGVHFDAIRIMVNGYAEWSAKSDQDVLVTLSDCIARAGMSAEKQDAVQAVADARGLTFGSAKRHRKDEIEQVRVRAEERAEKHGTRVADELPAVAEETVRFAKAAKAADKAREERHKKAHTLAYFSLESDLIKAKKVLSKALTGAEGVEFDAEERELIADTIAKVRAVLALIDLRITGSTNVDWDAELAKLGDPA